MVNGKMNMETPTNVTIKGILGTLMASVDEKKKKRLISLGMGDPTAYSCFTTNIVVQDSVVQTLESQKFNGYSPTVGLLQTRTAIAEYLSLNLPYKLLEDDVYITAGCTQAIEVAISILARPNANILVPKPGFPIYELCAAFRNVEIRHFDLLPDKGWEVDLEAVDALTDQNTVAIVIINPGNPCGNVYSYQHLKKIAEAAKKNKILVIADEVYGHLAFGENPFVPMGVFGSMVPVLTLGSLSKRWLVPGWRLGWFVTTDPNGIFKNAKTVERIKKYFDICGGPATFIQAAVPRILEDTKKAFFTSMLCTLKQTCDICFEKINEIPCFTCPQKPQGAMAVMVKLNVSLLKDISDDIDFCFKLAKEESVILLPGLTVGLKNWVRITFAAEPSSLEEALDRIKYFYQRHSHHQCN
ncbi:putative aminotransferase, class I/classII, tyrosine/nicotianamine aminotransferase [Helianthus annuus]|uniref:Aminotransferase, class I/classII, tyrosine/nicotianamine aminotransferase n=1 Tax=Helianthus annuus TaxID=4232 RepID=A0A251TKX9_HELAN|nr:probable aminotransferase TAT2 [Helianthus annuus]KAF5787174.1 putative aminotransferase, class I/classII, tyrosine/nicotianamine aminotransferase [Helianthus annuus]KAJ0514466.1 putative aminotransferase, class-I, pyridoxal-phosphate-binding, aminotransferase, class I/classII [Helianthus annuus]KAJ0522649.1 putative aminotransferase, class-I, pyridoxal-phosphate-binding, aminotransferase, class I/classII [Helianthus annuus]